MLDPEDVERLNAPVSQEEVSAGSPDRAAGRRPVKGRWTTRTRSPRTAMQTTSRESSIPQDSKNVIRITAIFRHSTSDYSLPSFFFEGPGNDAD